MRLFHINENGQVVWPGLKISGWFLNEVLKYVTLGGLQWVSIHLGHLGDRKGSNRAALAFVMHKFHTFFGSIFEFLSVHLE